jgi:vacuolar-type H+-ATPase subunit I/STV1
LLHGEATLLTNEEKALVKEQWSKLRDPKRMVEMLNKRRAEQNRGGKATRVSEKAVHAAIAEAKEAVRETLTK